MPFTHITFDCAQTLVEATWDPLRMMIDAADSVGLEVSPDQVQNWGLKVRAGWPALCAANSTRTIEPVEATWLQLTSEWLADNGLDIDLAPRLKKQSDVFCFQQPSKYFHLYEDVVPCLERLKLAGYSLAVISNWDRSLPWVLDMYALTGYFDLALASLVEGVEKPDPRLFEIALEKLGARADETIHIGDNPIDDVQGARSAGIHAVLLDRTGAIVGPGITHSLHLLEEAFPWND